MKVEFIVSETVMLRLIEIFKQLLFMGICLQY